MPKKKKYYVRADGLHETIRVINGKRVAFRGRTDAEVERKMLEYHEQLSRMPLFREVSEAWEDDHLPHLAYNTARNYKAQNRIVTDHFGDRPIDKITPADVQAFISSHRTQARKTVTNRLLTLNLIFNFAILRGYISVNPCAAVRIPRGLSAKHRRAPTEEETKIVKLYGTEPDEQYAGLLRRQAAVCNRSKTDILDRASRTYYDVANGKNKFLCSISCDFKALERECQRYNPNHRAKKNTGNA